MELSRRSRAGRRIVTSSSATASIGSLPTSRSHVPKNHAFVGSAATGILVVIRPRYARSTGAMADVTSREDSTPSSGAPEPTVSNRLRAFAVHIFTAIGAALGFLALLAAARGDWVAMFVWLAAALFVDGIDGTLARAFHTAALVPRWSGDALDLVVDFVTYVFVPAYAIAASDLMPSWLAVPMCLFIVVTSALYFCDREMKTADNSFRGFPALWNAIAFYLLLLRPPP